MPYQKDSTHKACCKDKCHNCLIVDSGPCPADGFWESCLGCFKTFRNKRCYQEHLLETRTLTKTGIVKSTKCQRSKRCIKCHVIYNVKVKSFKLNIYKKHIIYTYINPGQHTWRAQWSPVWREILHALSSSARAKTMLHEQLSKRPSNRREVCLLRLWVFYAVQAGPRSDEIPASSQWRFFTKYVNFEIYRSILQWHTLHVPVVLRPAIGTSHSTKFARSAGQNEPTLSPHSTTLNTQTSRRSSSQRKAALSSAPLLNGCCISKKKCSGKSEEKKMFFGRWE